MMSKNGLRNRVFAGKCWKYSIIYIYIHWEEIIKLFAITHGPCKNRPISQIPQCILQIFHNAPLRKRNIHMCAHFCYKMVYRGVWTGALWDLCIRSFVSRSKISCQQLQTNRRIEGPFFECELKPHLVVRFVAPVLIVILTHINDVTIAYDCHTDWCPLSKFDQVTRFTSANMVGACVAAWAPSQYPKRRLVVRSCKVSKPRDWYFKLSYGFEIWQAHRQHCCRSACQISERSGNSKYKSRGFETLRDLTERRLFGYWDRALGLLILTAFDENKLLICTWIFYFTVHDRLLPITPCWLYINHWLYSFVLLPARE